MAGLVLTSDHPAIALWAAHLCCLPLCDHLAVTGCLRHDINWTGYQEPARSLTVGSASDKRYSLEGPNVRAEAGPTAKRQARDADNSLRRFAGLVF